MADVTIHVNKRPYIVACAEGQEAHLRHLASLLDRKMAELIAGQGQVGDLKLLVMAGLLLADEAEEARREAEQRSKDASARATGDIAGNFAEAIDAVAGRLEALAKKLEAA